MSTSYDNSLSEFNPPCDTLNLQQGLCQNVDGSSWNYAIFWQIASSKNVRAVLIWRDGHCRDPRDIAIVREGGGDGTGRFGLMKDEAKKLEKRHAYFEGVDNSDKHV